MSQGYMILSINTILFFLKKIHINTGRARLALVMLYSEGKGSISDYRTQQQKFLVLHISSVVF